MKKTIALTVLLSTCAFAAERSVNDIMFLPKAGIVYGDSSLNYVKYTNRVSDGSSMVKTYTKGPVLQQLVGYSPVDNFTVAAAMGYVDTKSKTTGSRATTTQGLQDFNILSRLRLLDSDNRFDLLAQATFSPEDSRVEGDGDQNAYSGGHAIALGAEFGAKKSGTQWSLRALLGYKTEVTEIDKSILGTGDEIKIKSDPHATLDFAANLQTQLSESFFIRNFAEVIFEQEYDQKRTSDRFTILDSKVKRAGTTQYQVGAEFHYLASQDLVLKAGPTAVLGGNGVNTVIMIYNIGARYQF